MDLGSALVISMRSIYWLRLRILPTLGAAVVGGFLARTQQTPNSVRLAATDEGPRRVLFVTIFRQPYQRIYFALSPRVLISI